MKITGIVVKGKGEGKYLGSPTANLKPNKALTLADGVYLAETVYKDKKYKSLAVIIAKRDLEVWFLDFNGNLYGQEIKVEIGKKISEIIKSDNRQGLIKKIESDIKKAKKIWEIN